MKKYKHAITGDEMKGNIELFTEGSLFLCSKYGFYIIIRVPELSRKSSRKEYMCMYIDDFEMRVYEHYQIEGELYETG